MFVFVWIAFLALQSSLCFQTKGDLTSSELNTNEQNSTASYLNEGSRTIKLSDTPSIAAKLELTTVETTDSNNLECNSKADCTSQLDSSSAQPLKITWRTAASVTTKDADHQTTVSSTTSGKPESETSVMNHPTTPDIYSILNHNENELDSEVKYEGPHLTQIIVSTIGNKLDIMNVTDSSIVEKEDSLFSRDVTSASTSSKISEVSTQSPFTINDNESEQSLKISSPYPNFTFASRSVEISTIISSTQSDDIHVSDTTSASISTVSDATETKKEALGSVHPLFRYTRNTVSTSDFEKTTIMDHSVLDAESVSTMQESELPAPITINPDFMESKANHSSESIKLKEGSLQLRFLNSTAEETTGSLLNQPVVTTSEITDNDGITEEMGRASSDTMYSVTTVQSMKEIHTTVQSEASAPDISKDIHVKETSTPSSKYTDITAPFENLRHNSSSTSPFLESFSSEKTIEKMHKVTDLTSTSAPHHTVSNSAASDPESTVDNSLYKFNEISLSRGTTFPYEEKSSSMYPTIAPNALDEKVLVTTEVGLLNASVEHNKLQSAVTEEQEITVSSSLPSAKAELTLTPIGEDITSRPSSSLDLASVSLEDQPTLISSVGQTPSTTVDPPTLSIAVDQSNDNISSRTIDQMLSSTVEEISSHNVDQTLSIAVYPVSSSTAEPVSSNTSDPVSSSTVDQVSSSTPDQLTSSNSEQTFSDSGIQTSSSTVDQPVPPITVGHPTSYSTTDSPVSSSSVQQPITSSSIDPTNEVSLSSLSSTSSVIPVSFSSTALFETSASIHVFPSMLLTSTGHRVPNEETTSAISKMEGLDVTDSPLTTKPSSDYVTNQTSNIATETHREGKHIPFSTESTRRETVKSSNEVIVITSTTEMETTTVDLEEMIYNQLYYEDLTVIDKSNIITVVVELPAQDVDHMDINIKIAEVHSWLAHVLMKEFQNWTRDPFDEIGSQSSDVPFGKVTIFYILPTPKTKSSNITMTFIVHNQWRNETLPVDFVLSILKFYSADLKQSMNASSVHFYHGVSEENSNLFPISAEKLYVVIAFTTGLTLIGCILVTCVWTVCRKRNRRSVHYLANSKLQRNLQESVGIDLTPAVVILQDEKKILNGNSKICDDEGWLVPIHEVPLAEDNYMPNVLDTKL